MCKCQCLYGCSLTLPDTLGVGLQCVAKPTSLCAQYSSTGLATKVGMVGLSYLSFVYL